MESELGVILRGFPAGSTMNGFFSLKNFRKTNNQFSKTGKITVVSHTSLQNIN